jgi:hypothetical protein
VLPQRADTRQYETTLPLSKRDRMRAAALAATPWWYNEWGHLAFPSVVGIGLIVASIVLLDRPTVRELLAVPVVLFLVNINEWHIHRNILHARTWPLEMLFWRHTPEHHVIFVRDDMAMRSTREFRLVLIPFYGILAIFVTSLPITAALWFLVSHNVALLWVACTMGYTVAYEWLHLSYHLPESNPIARSALIRVLRHHHAVHHTPELMQRWNFNVTVPLADWLLRTVYREPAVSERAVAPEGRRRLRSGSSA